ncbi:hypothetical protein LOD99_9402 [Oopsacas minuta]|uniref:Uncharacterized protein n=1 Tax=Oopsacas minuta TaxID=111878 RepID=A0AAV7JBX6_9METZ|nr:hypothetical protein LOD99_9402 [Oopsacas minuta]
MEFLIVSKAAIRDVPKFGPPRPYVSSTNRTRQKWQTCKPKISISLDSLNVSEKCEKVKPKKIRKSKKSHSISLINHIENSPQKVSKYTNNRHIRTCPSNPVLTRYTDNIFTPKLNVKPPAEPKEFSPDRIIKRAISNIMCRSATQPLHTPVTSNSIQELRNCVTHKLPTNSATKSIKFPKPGHFLSHQAIPPQSSRKKRIYLSDPQNPGVVGSTAGRIPPLNSPIDVSHSFEIVPSLGDAKSQVSLQKELRNLEAKRIAISLANTEKARVMNDKRTEGEKLRARIQFRAEIYALNKEMRLLEENKFKEALSAKV